MLAAPQDAPDSLEAAIAAALGLRDDRRQAWGVNVKGTEAHQGMVSLGEQFQRREAESHGDGNEI
jgi:hypothetical protein